MRRDITQFYKMKKFNVFMLVACFVVFQFLSSCNKSEDNFENEILVKQTESVSEINAFSSKEELKNAINNTGYTRSASSVSAFDSDISEVLVPNENFRKLLNEKGQIIVDDTLYMITRQGTLFTHMSNQTVVDTLSDFSVFEQVSTDLKKFNEIFLFDTFKDLSEEDFYEEPDGDEEDISSISTRATAYNLQRDPVDIKNFPVMSTEPYTLVGKGLAGLFGNNSAHKIDIQHKRRLSASLYSYNYLVYSETGLKAAVIRRRSLLHNWTKEASWGPGTVMGWEHIHFVYDKLDIPDMPDLHDQTKRMTYGKFMGNLAKVSTLYKFDKKVSDGNIITIPIILGKEIEVNSLDIANAGIDLMTKAGLDYLKKLGDPYLIQALEQREAAINKSIWNTNPFQKVPIPGISIHIIDLKKKQMHVFIGSDKIWKPGPSQVKVFDSGVVFEVEYNSNLGLVGSALKTLAKNVKNKAPNVESAFVYAYTTTDSGGEVKGMILKKTKDK